MHRSRNLFLAMVPLPARKQCKRWSVTSTIFSNLLQRLYKKMKQILILSGRMCRLNLKAGGLEDFILTISQLCIMTQRKNSSLSKMGRDPTRYFSYLIASSINQIFLYHAPNRLAA